MNHQAPFPAETVDRSADQELSLTDMQAISGAGLYGPPKSIKPAKKIKIDKPKAKKIKAYQKPEVYDVKSATDAGWTPGPYLPYPHYIQTQQVQY